ncbi:MAG: ABC transporter ATP-binding protein [Tistlia sp.]|uniref:ABC transporter ATP-binding protein n=1 Tax=Tistlia sp. TaxID=3057121 RepID=UPI0034A3EBAA
MIERDAGEAADGSVQRSATAAASVPPPAKAALAAPRIVVRNLVKRFRTRRGDVLALDDVSLEIGVSEKVVLLGPSGCGKTTLLRCVAGLEEPDSGEIEINGTLVFSSRKRVSVPPEQRGISMVFQSYALWPHLTVMDNVAYPLVNQRVPRDQIRQRVEKALAMVGCEALLQRYPAQLSGGQQQRVSLARAVVGSDGVVLFDEPLSNVDAKVREQLRVELVAMQRRLGFSALYVTHDQTEATALGHRIAVMGMGKVAQVGAPRDIYERPCSRYVANFVGAVNELPGRVVERNGLEVAVETAVGRIVSSNGGDFQPGAEVVVMVRPEHLRFAAPGEAAAGSRLVGTLESAMFLGLYSEYPVVVGEQRLLVRSMQAEAVEEGQEVTLQFDPANVLVFA